MSTMAQFGAFLMAKDDIRKEIREAEDDLVALLKWKRGQSLERPFDRMGEDKAICRALGLIRCFKDSISGNKR